MRVVYGTGDDDGRHRAPTSAVGLARAPAGGRMATHKPPPQATDRILTDPTQPEPRAAPRRHGGGGDDGEAAVTQPNLATPKAKPGGGPGDVEVEAPDDEDEPDDTAAKASGPDGDGSRTAAPPQRRPSQR